MLILPPLSLFYFHQSIFYYQKLQTLAAGLLTCFSFPLECKFHEGKDLVCVVQWVL